MVGWRERDGVSSLWRLTSTHCTLGNWRLELRQQDHSRTIQWSHSCTNSYTYRLAIYTTMDSYVQLKAVPVETFAA